MPGNPADHGAGDTSGLWKVVLYFVSPTAHTHDMPGQTHAENLSFEEARELAAKLDREWDEIMKNRGTDGGA